MKEKLLNKKMLVYIATIILSVVYLLVASNIALGDEGVFDPERSAETIRAKVLRVTDKQEVSYEIGGDSASSMQYIYFEARALNGEEKGKTLSAVQEIDTVYAIRQPEVEKDDTVLLVYTPTQDSDTEYYLSDFSRTGPLIYLLIAFFALLLIFGRKKGLDTIISLGFTCLAVFTTLLPAILNGQNIYFWSILTCVFIIVMTLLIVNGANIKSLAAGLGCVGGVLISGLVVLMMRGSLKLTGLLEEDSVYLVNLNPDDPIDLKAIIFAMIIVGAVGAVMDVAMSISSSLQELHDKSPGLKSRELLRSGLTIGRDIMGTMANTLVLAYIGSSLTCVLLLVALSGGVMQILNREVVVVDILQALAGSMGILSALPLTAVLSTMLFKTFGKKQSNGEEKS